MTTRPGSGGTWLRRWTGCPGIAERAGPLLGPPAPPSFEGLVTALVNELDAEPGKDEVLLVLDDYHLIDSQAVHASLRFLLEHLPSGLRLVLTSRSDPPLPLARLRASGQLAELRADDLRFTTDEAAALLREAAGADLPDAAVAVLAARTEGWAAGLQLAALSLRGQEDAAGFVAALAEQFFQEAIQIAIEDEAKTKQLRAVTSLAKLWQTQGKIREARGLLKPLYDSFTEGFEMPDMKNAKALLESPCVKRN
jgi:hypothetical protein